MYGVPNSLNRELNKCTKKISYFILNKSFPEISRNSNLCRIFIISNFFSVSCLFLFLDVTQYKV